ncbi:MAG: AlpA family phage regulatory protein [Sulfitobacter sp.]|nr:AlpA family phage regulatory protein [Sulfitobacter sp.]
MIDRILRCQDVLEITGLSRSTIYRMMERSEFPKPTRIGMRAIGWRESIVGSWISTRNEAS